MDEFLKDMADILDEESVGENSLLADFSSWDSLAVLSVMAMADSRFHTAVSASAIRGAGTVGDLYTLLSSSAATG